MQPNSESQTQLEQQIASATTHIQHTRTMPELYETLASGNTFKMRFATKAEAKSFRDRLATHKHRTEKQLKMLGVIEPLSLCMSYNSETGVAEFSIKQRERKELLTYEVLDIEPAQQDFETT